VALNGGTRLRLSPGRKKLAAVEELTEKARRISIRATAVSFGDEQEKLMAFCLAGALSFNLADPHGNDNRPIFAQLMLDEAFSKSDPQFAQQALSPFRKFGFQLIIVATVQNTSTIQPYVDNVVVVSNTEAGPELRPVTTATSTGIKAFSELRRSGSQLRVSESTSSAGKSRSGWDSYVPRR